MDRRGPAPDYPDTKEKLSAIPEDDYELIGDAASKGRALRDARLAEDEVQIRGCASP